MGAEWSLNCMTRGCGRSPNNDVQQEKKFNQYASLVHCAGFNTLSDIELRVLLGLFAPLVSIHDFVSQGRFERTPQPFKLHRNCLPDVLICPRRPSSGIAQETTARFIRRYQSEKARYTF